MGNPILGDDGVGIQIVRSARERINQETVDVKEASVRGIELVELMIGYHRAVLVDAMDSRFLDVGETRRFSIHDFEPCATTIHDLNVINALSIANRLGIDNIPEHITVVGIGIGEARTFTESMNPQVINSIPRAMDMILKEIDRKDTLFRE